MRATLITLLCLLLFVVGCSEPPPFATDKPLTDSQLDWYLAKAAAWMASDGGGWRSSVDYTKPPTRKLSMDKSSVDVVFPTKTSNNTVVVRVDIHTGKVKETSEIIGGLF